MTQRFFWAEVDEDATTFLEAYERKDRSLLSASLEHSEDSFPELTVIFRNEGLGLLFGPSWGWLAYEDAAGTVTPLFFGQRIGIPSNILGEKITVKYVAMPLDYNEQFQALAETLKTPDNWDPIFIRPELLDDPHTILEAYSAMRHIDRVTHEVSVSDVLQGEDGDVELDTSDVIRNSVDWKISEDIKNRVTIKADVSWTQRHANVIDMGRKVFFTYTGDGFMSEWPKPLANIGGGWSVESSTAKDINGVEHAITPTLEFKYRNKRKTHETGDTLTIDLSVTTPMAETGIVNPLGLIYGARVGILSGLTGQSTKLNEQYTPGFLDPFADPQINRPASLKYNTLTVPLWKIETALTLAYKAQRPRVERLRFTMTSDIQSIIEQSAGGGETIEVSGVDVGLPIFNVLNWSTVRLTNVELGQIVQTDNPDTYQIVTTAGLTGSTEPDWSEFLGETTLDGTATWTSLGDSPIPANTPGWEQLDPTPLGQVILPRSPRWIAWAILQPTPVPVSVAEGLVVLRTNGASYQIATVGGSTLSTEPAFNDTRGATTTSGTVTWKSLGPTLPGSAELQIATTAGTTGELEPAFAQGTGATTSDGSVTWTSLGTTSALLGAPLEDTSRFSYFQTDRGQRSIRYLINIGRAYLRQKARASRVECKCRFERALEFSCRKNLVVPDSRFPAGIARGKITSYRLDMNIEKGRFEGFAVMESAIGNGGTATLVDGEPVYVDGVFDDFEVQQWYGAVVEASPSEDIGYTPPVNTDQDFVFPLTKAQVVVREETFGSLAEQEAVIQEGFAVARTNALANQHPEPTEINGGDYITQSLTITGLADKVARTSLREVPIYHEFELKSLETPSDNEHEIFVTLLAIEKMIDLGGV